MVRGCEVAPSSSVRHVALRLPGPLGMVLKKRQAVMLGCGLWVQDGSRLLFRLSRGARPPLLLSFAFFFHQFTSIHQNNSSELNNETTVPAHVSPRVGLSSAETCPVTRIEREHDEGEEGVDVGL